MAKKPNYRVAALDKDTEASANIGAAWLNENGTITIVLNDFVVLPPGGKHLLITLFPNKDKSE